MNKNIKRTILFVMFNALFFLFSYSVAKAYYDMKVIDIELEAIKKIMKNESRYLDCEFRNMMHQDEKFKFLEKQLIEREKDEQRNFTTQ